MALLLQSLSADLELLPNVTLAQASEKPIRHLSIIYCIFLAEIAIAAILPRFGNGNRYQFIV
jgi:Mn2+/Fe2+ NRAMP family transporter